MGKETPAYLAANTCLRSLLSHYLPSSQAKQHRFVLFLARRRIDTGMSRFLMTAMCASGCVGQNCQYAQLAPRHQ